MTKDQINATFAEIREERMAVLTDAVLFFRSRMRAIEAVAQVLLGLPFLEDKAARHAAVEQCVADYPWLIRNLGPGTRNR